MEMISLTNSLKECLLDHGKICNLSNTRLDKLFFVLVPTVLTRWRSGVVVRVSDFGPRGPWFEPRPVHISLWP